MSSMPNPEPAATRTSEDAFFEYYAAESLKEPTARRFAGIKSAVERAAQAFGVVQGTWDVGDIGCNAATQCMLWARDGHRLHGVDINERLVELGRQRAREAGLAMQLSVGSAAALPWADQSLDVCLSPELLEHVADWETCLREAARVLRPGGILFVSTTNRLCPRQDEFNLPAYSWYPAALKRHYERRAITDRPDLANYAKYPAVNWFTYFELRDFLAGLGFRSLDRFDVAARSDVGPVGRFILGAIRSFRPVRWLAHVATPYTMVFAQKQGSAP